MLHAIFLLLSLTIALATTERPIAMPGCQDMCGNVSIPFPCGVGKDCYLNKWYEITCTENVPRLSSIKVGSTGVEVLRIEHSNEEILIKGPIISSNCANRGRNNTNNGKLELPEESPYSQ